MKLSSAYLAEQLEKEYKVLGRAGLSEKDGYLRPFFYSGISRSEKDGRPPKAGDGRVCIIPQQKSGEVHPGERVFCVFCENPAGGAESEDLHCSEPYVRIAQSPEGAADVLNELQQIFDRCDEWERRMDGLLAEHAGITRMLEETYHFLGNPLSVISLDFSLLGEAGQEKLPKRARLFVDDGINMEYVNALLQDETYQKLADTKECVQFPGYITGCRSLNRNLYVDGQVVGRLVLTECEQPIGSGAVCILETLAGRLEYLLAHEASASKTGDMEQIFEQILSDRTADPMQISHQLSALGWSADHEYLCMVMQITYLDQKQLSTKAISRSIKKQFPDAVSFLYQEEIVTFFNLSLLGLSQEEVSEKLVYFIRDSYLKAGYSRTVQGHMRLRRQYVQARTALDVGSRKKPYLWIHHFNQIVMPYILEQATRRLPGTMLCHEGLLELKAMDEKNHTEYVVTLKAYLEQNLSATQAARSLFIHRSTFLYRLERIREILQSELEDPEEIFYLQFSLRLLEQEEEKE